MDICIHIYDEQMDRTSIVADAIDYIKDLLHKINQLREDTTDNDDSNRVMENRTGFNPPNEVTNPTWPPKVHIYYCWMVC